MAAYDNVIGGTPKLKGKALDVKAGGDKKKKKKKKQKKHEEQALKITEHELIEGENVQALGKLIEEAKSEKEDGKVQPGDDDDMLSPAERLYIEQKQRLDVQKLAKEANVSP